MKKLCNRCGELKEMNGKYGKICQDCNRSPQNVLFKKIFERKRRKLEAIKQ